MAMIRSEGRTVLLMVLCAVFWGAAFPLTRYTVLAMAPLTAAFLRYGMAGAGFAAAMETSGELRGGITRRRLWLWGIIGFFGIFLYNALFFVGMTLATAAEGAVIIPLLNPVIGAVLGALFFRERLTPRFLAGGAVALLGTALVVMGGAGRADSFHLRGDLMLVGACLAWGAYGVTGKLAMRAGASPLAVTGWSDILGTAFFIPLVLWESLASGRAAWWTAPSGVWLALAVMAVFPTILSFTWWNQGVKELGVARASLFIYLVPVSGLLISVLWLGESLLPWQWAGAALAAAGVVWGQTGRG